MYTCTCTVPWIKTGTCMLWPNMQSSMLVQTFYCTQMWKCNVVGRMHDQSWCENVRSWEFC